MAVVETSGSVVRGVGQRLKQAREAKKISIDTVASDLFILKRHLEAIERDDYDSLPQAAFTRGFILSYAKYLKLDVDSILSDFETTYPKKQEVATKDLAESIQGRTIAKVSRNQSTQKTSFGRYGLLLALAGLVGLGLFYYTSTQQPRDEVMERKNDTVTALDSLQQAEQKQVAQGDANVAQTTPVPVVVDPNAPAVELEFWVRRHTEITITDQTGKVVMTGKKSRGAYKTSGKPPFKVSITPYKLPQDASPRVTLTMDKTPQSKQLSNQMQADGSVNMTLSK